MSQKLLFPMHCGKDQLGYVRECGVVRVFLGVTLNIVIFLLNSCLGTAISTVVLNPFPPAAHFVTF